MKKKLLLLMITFSTVTTIFFGTFVTRALTSNGIVTGNNVRLRDGAGTSYSIIIVLEKDSIVNLLGTTADATGDIWYNVSYSNDGETYIGYMHSDFISEINDELEEIDEEDVIIGPMATTFSTTTLAKTGTVSGNGVNVRSGPGTSHTRITSLNSGVIVDLLGTANDNSGVKWYNISFISGSTRYTGYMHSDFIQENIEYTFDTNFEDYLTAQGFPESYKVELRKLHALHPNWVFQAVHTGLDWQASVEAEYGYDVSLTQSTKEGDRSKSPWSYNPNTGNYLVFDGSNWYAASRDLVARNLNPVNFLNLNSIFMFEKLTYSSAHHTQDAVSKVLENSAFSMYAGDFVTVGASTNVNPIHLASRVIQEQGRGGSLTSNGSSFTYGNKTYSGYFNVFNIGATSGPDNWVKALIYAMDVDNLGTYGRPWNTLVKSIRGGSLFLSAAYISRGQDTIYFQRFNVAPYTQTTKYRHQYMTSIHAHVSEASNVYSAYNGMGLLNSSFVFSIPVYNNMPGDNESNNNNNNNNNGNNNVESIDFAAKIGWSKNGNYVSGFSVGQNISSVITSIKAIDNSANVNIVSSRGVTKSNSGAIATGDVITIVHNNTTIKYTVVLYGDVTGDGAITTSDLLSVRRQILGLNNLSGAFLQAANASRKTSSAITTSDLLAIRRHILGYSTIKQ